jgi:hypothetical protein
MIYWLLCADFICSLLGSLFFALGSGGKAIDLIIGAVLGVSATVAIAAIAIIHAIDEIPRPPKASSIPSEI